MRSGVTANVLNRKCQLTTPNIDDVLKHDVDEANFFLLMEASPRSNKDEGAVQAIRLCRTLVSGYIKLGPRAAIH